MRCGSQNWEKLTALDELTRESSEHVEDMDVLKLRACLTSADSKRPPTSWRCSGLWTVSCTMAVNVLRYGTFSNRTWGFAHVSDERGPRAASKSLEMQQDLNGHMLDCGEHVEVGYALEWKADL